MIAVDGGEVWADDSGGDGPPLVLLHPGVGDSRIWEPVLPALTAEVMEQLRSGARAEISSGDMQQEDPPVYGRLGEISVPASLLVGGGPNALKPRIHCARTRTGSGVS